MFKKIHFISRLGLHFAACMAILFASHLQAAEQKQLKVVNNPVATDKPKTEYPTLAARNKRQGWVILDLDINAQGKVEKSYVIESFGDTPFVAAATEAVQGWQYKPKKSPASQYLTNVRVEFTKGGKRKVTSGFASRIYNKATKLIANGELDDALEILQKIKFEKLVNYTEINLALNLWAAYGQAIKDKQLQLAYLEKLNLNKSQSDEKTMFSTFRQKLILQFELNRLVNAKRTFADIKRLKVAKPYIPAFEKVIAKIDAKAFVAKDLVVPGKVIWGNKWRHALARKSFTITDIKGDIDSASIRCLNKVKPLSLDALAAVNIPKRGTNCYLDVVANKGTTFSVVEHPL